MTDSRHLTDLRLKRWVGGGTLPAAIQQDRVRLEMPSVMATSSRVRSRSAAGRELGLRPFGCCTIMERSSRSGGASGGARVAPTSRDVYLRTLIQYTRVVGVKSSSCFNLRRIALTCFEAGGLWSPPMGVQKGLVQIPPAPNQHEQQQPPTPAPTEILSLLSLSH